MQRSDKGRPPIEPFEGMFSVTLRIHGGKPDADIPCNSADHSQPAVADDFTGKVVRARDSDSIA